LLRLHEQVEQPRARAHHRGAAKREICLATRGSSTYFHVAPLRGAGPYHLIIWRRRNFLEDTYVTFGTFVG
jgi:hypothetical protein